MKLKYLVTILHTLKMPGLFQIIRDWNSFLRLHFIYAGLESGLLEALSTPCSRETLIQRLNVKRPDLLDALLDVGLSVKELGYRNTLYWIKGKRSKAVIGQEGDILAAMIQANVTYCSGAYRKVATRMSGGPLGDDLEDIGGLVARFSKIGEPFISHFITDIVIGRKPMRILDVGCGSGVFLKTTYNANRNATGIGIDVDMVAAEQARQNINKWKLGDRFRIITGDIRVPADGLEGPFDLITLYNIMYYFPSTERVELFQKLRSKLSPQGTLAVAMNFQSDGKDIGAANLNLVNCSLKGLTRLPGVEELIAQLKETGFHKIKTQRLIPGSTYYGIAAMESPPRPNRSPYRCLVRKAFLPPSI
ncbi:MAG: class I SAM-dependent methyltransferase [Deltaproteobacteria bacterium]|nr:class I SAM-dependent methyltransferase [Deltaproteobacteria bacterium]MBF0523818.1 class I SAM-dependent methyltransferase [Deltaproteobacteria bacterium]